MNTVKGSTKSEIRMIKAVQTAIGALSDGEIGTQTMSDIAAIVKADCFPLTLKIYSQAVIIAKDVVAFNPGSGLAPLPNSISGSFSYDGKPCSILVNYGKAICDTACHGWLNFPETVIYKRGDGVVAAKRARTTADLPGNLKWAVGGVGLLTMYNPLLEGFAKFNHGGKSYDYTDVLRKTNHTMMGAKNGMVYLAYCKNMTAAQVNAFAGKLGLDYAIMLDGGHVAAINGEETFAQININQRQYYAIQAK